MEENSVNSHVLTQLLRLAEAQPIDAGLNLPEDLSERLDDYLYADLRRGLADVDDGDGSAEN